MKEFSDIELLHDSRWTAEAISNVLDNAVKYSPGGSAIQIRVEPMVSYVFIEVEDEGIGIEKSEYQNIFKRFYRGKRPEVEAEEGAGVGLYLVRKIFEGQGKCVCGSGTSRGNRDPHDASEEICGMIWNKSAGRKPEKPARSITKMLFLLKGSCKNFGV